MAVSTIKLDYVPFTELNSNISYARKNGVAYLKMSSNGVNITRNGVLLGTLPTGFRPQVQLDFAGTALGGTAETFFRIDPNGQVTGYSNPDTTYWSGSPSFIIAN